MYKLSGTISNSMSCRGMRLEYLPAYSPDFNPIELSFSLLKGRLRHDPPNVEDESALIKYLFMQVLAIDEGKCRSFYHHCGYI